MFAIIAAIFFALAFLFHGGAVSIHSAWFNVTGLVLAGLFFLALACTPFRR